MVYPHHSLVAWRRADDLFVKVHHLAKARFPAHERYVLTSQTRRAALSVPLNIVEGFARRHLPERLQFLRVSWASLAELDYCLHVARRLAYISQAEYDRVDKDLARTAAPLRGLMNQVIERVQSSRRSQKA
jgi:four helix bundle protein